eukprot:49348-Eustigmatos_ZCMA.PRE.1
MHKHGCAYIGASPHGPPVPAAWRRVSTWPLTLHRRPHCSRSQAGLLPPVVPWAHMWAGRGGSRQVYNARAKAR